MFIIKNKQKKFKIKIKIYLIGLKEINPILILEKIIKIIENSNYNNNNIWKKAILYKKQTFIITIAIS